MNAKSSWLIWTGVAAIGIVAGIAYAIVQPRLQTSSEPSAPVISATPQQTTQPTTNSSNTTKSSPSVNTVAPPKQTAQNASASTSNQTSTQRNVIQCTISMAVVADPESPLNVRFSPTTGADNVVGQLKNGTYVSVVKQRDGWLQISDPMQGWIAKNRTESGCNQKVEEVKFAASATSATVRDRFIGTGSHEYVFQANQGQTVTLTVQDGSIPAVFAPGGKVLNDPTKENVTTWSGSLPTTGDYRFVLDSNYKGYDYSFTVQIK